MVSSSALLATHASSSNTFAMAAIQIVQTEATKCLGAYLANQIQMPRMQASLNTAEIYLRRSARMKMAMATKKTKKTLRAL